MNKPKWIRNSEKKLPTFAAADASRTAWLVAHPNTDVATSPRPKPAYKARIKARPNGSFSFVTWSAVAQGEVN